MHRAYKILVVDDDEGVRLVTAQTLVAAGYTVTEAASGPAALTSIALTSPGLVVLDVNMPGMNGIAVVTELRSRGFSGPVLMLTSYGGAEQVVEGLTAGADDYVTKPVDHRVLRARVQALLRREPGRMPRARKLYFDDTVVDLELSEAHCGGSRVALTRTEFLFLGLLARNPGKPVSRAEILAAVWGYAPDANTRTVETHLWRLRKKLGDDAADPLWIQTRHGLGYMLSPAAFGASRSEQTVSA